MTARRFRAVADPATVLAADLDAVVSTHPLRVAVDGPACADPHRLATSLGELLRARGRPTRHVRADMFWRDASLRLEHGRRDVQALPGWLDAEAMRREVLVPLGPRGSGKYLPSLRDPSTNRVTREPPVRAADRAIVLISGWLLLGRGLPFDRTIHLAVSAAARRRRTSTEWHWTLPAFDDYDRDVDPVGTADLVVRCDDPVHPAISTGS